jgi:hypothetical protein
MSPKIEEADATFQEINNLEEHLLNSGEFQGRKPTGYDEDGHLDDYD